MSASHGLVLRFEAQFAPAGVQVSCMECANRVLRLTYRRQLQVHWDGVAPAGPVLGLLLRKPGLTSSQDQHSGGHDHEEHAHDHADHGHAGHDHGHRDHAHDLREASRRSLFIALTLTGSYMIAEVIGGLLSGSLALLADAGHMLTDAASIALALLAMWISNREATVARTFGFHRTEVLAALINTVSLWLIAAWIFYEAYHRFLHGAEIEGVLMLSVGAVGLLVNIIVAYVLHAQAGHSLNVHGAFLHVLGDLMGTVGVIVSGILILTFGWDIADPIISVVIGALILISTRPLFQKVMQVLVEGTPEHVDMYKLCADIEDVDGVTVIHDVHVWTISSNYYALSAHVLIEPSHDGDSKEMLAKMRNIAYSDYNITHATFQLETTVSDCHEGHHVGHLLARAESHL